MPDIILLVNSGAFLALAIMCAHIFWLWHSKKTPCEIGKTILANAVLFSFFAVISAAWGFGLISPSDLDAKILYTLFIVGLTATFLITIYQLTYYRNIFIIGFLYALSLVGTYYAFAQFSIVASIISIAVMALCSLDLIFYTNPNLKKAGYAGLLFFGSALATVLLAAGNLLANLWFIPLTFLFLFYFFISKDITICHALFSKTFSARHICSPAAIIAKLIIYTFSWSFILLFSVLAIHELGHALAAQYYGCESAKAIVYDILDYPHTEIRCQQGVVNMTVVSLAGIVLTLFAGLLLLLVKVEEVSFSTIFLSLSLFFSYNDLLELGISVSILLFMYLIGFSLLVYGYVKLTSEYLRKSHTDCEQDHMPQGKEINIDIPVMATK